MVNRILIRIVGLCAACMLPTLALARSHDSGGFYIGAGAHVTGAELEFTRQFATADNLTLTFTGLGGTYGTDADANGVTHTDPISLTLIASQSISIAMKADEDSDAGYGIHAGYKINEFFSVEVAYSQLGEFTGSYSFVPTPLGASIPVNVNDGASDTDILTAVTTLRVNSVVEANAFSGAVLGSYPLADNASVFGRLGYYSADISEESTFSWTGDVQELNISGNVGLNKELIEENSGLLYGGGIELAFGGNRNILVRGEFNVLADGLGEIDDITQFGLTASWKF